MLKKWGLCAVCMLLMANSAVADDNYYIGALEKASGRNNYTIRPMFAIDFHYNIITDRAGGIKALPNNFSFAEDFAKVRQEYPSNLTGSLLCLSDKKSITGRFSSLKRPWKYDNVTDIGTYKLDGTDYDTKENSCLMTSDNTDIRFETKIEEESQNSEITSSVNEITDIVNNLEADGLYKVDTDTKTYSFYNKERIYIAVTKITAVPVNEDSNLQTIKKIFIIAKKQQTYKIVASYDGSDDIELISVIDPGLIPVRSSASYDKMTFGKQGFYLLIRNENPTNVTYVLLCVNNDADVTLKYEYTYKKP